MKVTAEIKKLFDEGKVKAAGSLVIEGVFVIRNVRLVDGSKGMFVSMPSFKNADGEYIDICFPITNDFRMEILNTVVEAYNDALLEQDGTDDEDDASDED